MDEDFFNYLVATGQLDDFLGLEDDEDSEEDSDTESENEEE